jgi:hypothetical protein
MRFHHVVVLVTAYSYTKSRGYGFREKERSTRTPDPVESVRPAVLSAPCLIAVGARSMVIAYGTRGEVFSSSLARSSATALEPNSIFDRIGGHKMRRPDGTKMARRAA